MSPDETSLHFSLKHAKYTLILFFIRINWSIFVCLSVYNLLASTVTVIFVHCLWYNSDAFKARAEKCFLQEQRELVSGNVWMTKSVVKPGLITHTDPVLEQCGWILPYRHTPTPGNIVFCFGQSPSNISHQTAIDRQIFKAIQSKDMEPVRWLLSNTAQLLYDPQMKSLCHVGYVDLAKRILLKFSAKPMVLRYWQLLSSWSFPLLDPCKQITVCVYDVSIDKYKLPELLTTGNYCMNKESDPSAPPQDCSAIIKPQEGALK